MTVRRTIMEVNLSSDQNAATEWQLGAIGFQVANNNAITAGVGSLLTPVTDASDEAWFLWAPLTNKHAFATAAGFDSNGGRTFMIDSKAQRRLQDGQSLALVVENASATTGLIISVTFSMLIGFGLKHG